MRVYNTSHLANRSLAGDIARGHNTVTSIVDAYDARKRNKMLQQRDDEEYEARKKRQGTLQSREDTLYNQQQEDRERNLEYGAEDRERLHAQQDRQEARLNRQEGRQQQQHEENMYRAQDYREQESYRRNLEDLTIAARQAGMEDADLKRQISRFDLEQRKEAHKKEAYYNESQRLDALMANDASPEEINQSVSKIAKMTGMSLPAIDADAKLVRGLQDHLANNGTLDDPKMLPALQAIWKSRSAMDGRGDKYKLVGMMKTPEGDYIPKLEYKDGSGKVGHQTYGKSSDDDDLLQKFSRPEIMQMATSYDDLAKKVGNIHRAYGLTKEPEKQPLQKLKEGDALYDPNTGEEVYRNTGGGAAEEQSGPAAIMARKYEELNDATGALINNQLSQFGIHSEDMVEDIRKKAKKDDIDPTQLAAQVGQHEKNKKEVPNYVQDLVASTPELTQMPGFEKEAVKKLKKHFKKADATQEEGKAKIMKMYNSWVRRELKNKEREAEKAAKKEERKRQAPNRRQMYERAAKKQMERLEALNNRMLGQ